MNVVVSNTIKLSKIFVDTITRHNQHITMMTVGKTGAGKSWANLRLAYDCACEFARRKGGTWKDYFSLDNVMVIELKKVYEILKEMEKFNIYIFDDIGVGWSSRNWMDEVNRALNDIFQIFRTKNCILLLTLPDTFLLDKVPRSLVHYFAEMEMSIFEKGVTLAKVFKVVKHPRSGDLNYPYLRVEGRQFVRCVFPKPPAELTEPYERIRERKADEVIVERITEIEEKKKKKTEKKEVKDLKKERYPEAVRLVEQGYPVEEACEMAGISTQYYYKLRKQKRKMGTMAV